jgi:Kef-type K+ transport system membrane component KefB
MNETKLLRTSVGITALGAAALDDVTAWYTHPHHTHCPDTRIVHVSACFVCLCVCVCFFNRSLLALSFALIHASEPKVSLYIILAVSAYATFVLGVVRPLWWKVVDRVRQCTYLHVYAYLYICIFIPHPIQPSAAPPPSRSLPCLSLCLCDSRWMTRVRTRSSLASWP